MKHTFQKIANIRRGGSRVKSEFIFWSPRVFIYDSKIRAEKLVWLHMISEMRWQRNGWVFPLKEFDKCFMLNWTRGVIKGFKCVWPWSVVAEELLRKGHYIIFGHVWRLVRNWGIWIEGYGNMMNSFLICGLQRNWKSNCSNEMINNK